VLPCIECLCVRLMPCAPVAAGRSAFVPFVLLFTLLAHRMYLLFFLLK